MLNSESWREAGVGRGGDQIVKVKFCLMFSYVGCLSQNDKEAELKASAKQKCE